jgi:hypothetical protein
MCGLSRFSKRSHCSEFQQKCEQDGRSGLIRSGAPLAIVTGMTIRHDTRSLMLLCLLVATPSLSMAAESIAEAPRRPSIRSTDRRLRSLLEDGLRVSPTLRVLVARLHASDVVVYLQCDGPSGPDGRLTFLTTAGGYRYVVVRMARFPRSQQIAMMAHELQHAVEIAETPAIVDGPSLVREYRRIGYENPWSQLPGVSFDTRAAVRVGEQVLRELMQEDYSY